MSDPRYRSNSVLRFLGFYFDFAGPGRIAPGKTKQRLDEHGFGIYQERLTAKKQLVSPPFLSHWNAVLSFRSETSAKSMGDKAVQTLIERLILSRNQYKLTLKIAALTIGSVMLFLIACVSGRALACS